MPTFYLLCSLETNASSETLAFIAANRQKKAAEVALYLSKKPELPKEFILNQISGYQKALKKLPFLIDFPDFIFPDSRAVAQSSSETTAKFKAELIKGEKILDASGGMGMDSYFFSKKFNHLSYLEPNQELFRHSQYNFMALGAKNVECKQENAKAFLEQTTELFDWIYLDPDRRKGALRKFRIEDCEPNVLELLPLIWKKTERLLVKLSPMLDISYALEAFPECKVVYIVSVNNECKELLFVLEKDFQGIARIHAVDTEKNIPVEFNYELKEEEEASANYSRPLNFLYEPNASILKGGAFNLLAKRFDLYKLAPNTHLYTSEKVVPNFPGRTIQIKSTGKPQKGLVKQANVVCRNFHLRPEELKKKYKIQDGGELFLYACTLLEKERVFIVGTKIN